MPALHGLVLLLAIAATVVSGCAAHLPTYALGRYRGSQESLFVETGRALLDEGYSLVATDAPRGRISIESRWHRERVHARIGIEITSDGWIVVRPAGDEVEIESEGFRAHPALAWEVSHLATRLRERLEVHVVARTASAAPPPTGLAVNPRTHRHPSAALVAVGNLVLTAGWLGSVGVGQWALESTTSACANDYAAMHWAPLGGWLAAIVDGTRSCRGGISPLFYMLDIVSGAAQLAGLVLTVLGVALGEESIVLDGPAELEIVIAPIADSTTIGAAAAIAY